MCMVAIHKVVYRLLKYEDAFFLSCVKSVIAFYGIEKKKEVREVP